ncbi:MAG: diaminopimelate decarboxylase, partial [Bdellovibrionota bacterium]
IRAGIRSFNVESLAEAQLLESLARRLKKQVNFTLRFNPDVDAKTHPYISTGLKEDKFGLERSEILFLARKRSADLRLVGLSVHIGSQLLDVKPVDAALEKMAALAVEIEEILGRPLEFVDIGGGIGVRYHREKPLDIGKYCRTVARHFGRRAARPRTVFLEPGRYLVANAGILATQILYRKSRGRKEFVVVDAGMNDLIRPALYQSFHEILPTHRRGTRAEMTADVVGPVCESSDFLGKGRKIPRDLQSGDYLAVLSCGAYAFSMSSQYNSRPRAAEVLIDRKQVTLIRRRETIADLMRGEKPRMRKS